MEPIRTNAQNTLSECQELWELWTVQMGVATVTVEIEMVLPDKTGPDKLNFKYTCLRSHAVRCLTLHSEQRIPGANPELAFPGTPCVSSSTLLGQVQWTKSPASHSQLPQQRSQTSSVQSYT